MPTLLTTINESEHFLFNTLPSLNQKVLRDELCLARAKHFMDMIGNPQEGFKSIHVAGTSGKGSTCYYLTALLIAHGFKVGTHVSPHVYDVRERGILQGKLVGAKKFVRILNKLLPTVYKMSHESEYGAPSYYEIGFGQASTLFKQEAVDYAVVETAMGGLYDVTNTIQRNDKLAVLTKIGLDHTNILGTTYPEIAHQKAGILPHGGEGIYLLPQEEGVEEEFVLTARQRYTKLTPINVNNRVKNIQICDGRLIFEYLGTSFHLPDVTLPTVARYQVENACIALAALEVLSSRDGFALDLKAIRQALATCQIPGRMEIRHMKGRQIVLDGAHNPQKMKGLVDSLPIANKGGKKPVWIVAFKKGKDILNMLSIIHPQAHTILATTFFHAEDPFLSSMATLPSELQELASHSGIDLEPYAQPTDALNRALELTDPGQIIVIAGSMYVLNEFAKTDQERTRTIA